MPRTSRVSPSSRKAPSYVKYCSSMGIERPGKTVLEISYLRRATVHVGDTGISLSVNKSYLIIYILTYS